VRPNPSTVFEAHMHISVVSPSASFTGDGVVTADTPHNSILETYVLHINNQVVNEYLLWRFDLGSVYLVINNGSCQRGHLNTTTMPNPWAWLPSASFDGTRRSPAHQLLDYWYLSDSQSTRELGVFDDNVNVPAWDSYNTTTGTEEEIAYSVWQVQQPPSSTFNVPSACNSAQSMPLYELKKRSTKTSRMFKVM